MERTSVKALPRCPLRYISAGLGGTVYYGRHFKAWMLPPHAEIHMSARQCARGHESKRELAYVPDNNPTKTDSSGWAPATMATDNWIAGCECNAGDSIPCTVLDPFGGSGTVSMVAQHLGRDSVYIDINPDYREMAIRRCGFRENRLFELATYEVLEVAS